MYDISQLNDMIVPELLDIADQLKIPNAKKLDKQNLIGKIIDGQGTTAGAGKNGEEEKRKRKRIVKSPVAASVTADAVAAPPVEPVSESREEEKARKPEAR